MTQLLPHPHPLPLREVLRGVRHSLRRSRRALHEAVPPEALPGLAAVLARPVMGGLDVLAEQIDAAGTDLARRLLAAETKGVPPFKTLIADPVAGEAFAPAIYEALRGALRHMGDGDAFVSEAAARRSLDALRRSSQPDDPVTAAADLALALLSERVVRDAVPNPGLRVPTERVAAVAVVAVLLWLLTDREGADAGDALSAATDIAVALSDDVAVTIGRGDRAGLARLLEDFATHV